MCNQIKFSEKNKIAQKSYESEIRIQITKFMQRMITSHEYGLQQLANYLSFDLYNRIYQPIKLLHPNLPLSGIQFTTSDCNYPKWTIHKVLGQAETARLLKIVGVVHHFDFFVGAGRYPDKGFLLLLHPYYIQKKKMAL